MDPIVRALWTEALRSGHYHQIRVALHRTWPYPNMFCAFGVLCELHRLETGVDHWRGPNGRGDFYYLGNPYRVPQAVWDWAGLPEDLPINIIELNKHMDFRGIANLIEARL